MRQRTCCAWVDGAACGAPAVLYPAGHYCGDHAPWRYGTGHPPPIPDPEQTAEAFRSRARYGVFQALDGPCPHDEPRGARYCALCRSEARRRPS